MMTGSSITSWSAGQILSRLMSRFTSTLPSEASLTNSTLASVRPAWSASDLPGSSHISIMFSRSTRATVRPPWPGSGASSSSRRKSPPVTVPAYLADTRPPRTPPSSYRYPSVLRSQVSGWPCPVSPRLTACAYSSNGSG